MAFHDYADAFRIDLLIDVRGDLLCETLLYLEAACEAIDKTCQLTDAKHFAARDVADVADAEERQEVVLAEGIDFDVPHEDHVVGVDVEHRSAQEGDGVLSVAGEQRAPGVRDAARGLGEALAPGVFADGGEPAAHEGFGLVAVHGQGSANPWAAKMPRAVSDTRKSRKASAWMRWGEVVRTTART